MPEGVVHLLYCGRHGVTPVAGNGSHIGGGDPRHRLRLSQGAPFFQTRFNHRFIHRRHGCTGDKELHQFGLGNQAQTQREGIVGRRFGGRRKTDRHIGQGMTGVDMGEVVKSPCAHGHVHTSVAAAAQGGQQMRFRSLSVAIQPDGAACMQRTFDGALLGFCCGQPRQQSVGVVIQYRSVLAGLINPVDDCLSNGCTHFRYTLPLSIQ